MVANGSNKDEPNTSKADAKEQAAAGMSRAQFNAANEKLIEDQLQISEDKLFDYVPGEEK